MLEGEFFSEDALARLEQNQFGVKLQVQCAFLESFAHKGTGIVAKYDYTVAFFGVKNALKGVLGCLGCIHMQNRIDIWVVYGYKLSVPATYTKLEDMFLYGQRSCVRHALLFRVVAESKGSQLPRLLRKRIVQRLCP